jgi:hypothetical protein
MKKIEQLEQMVIDLDEQVKQLRSDNAVMDSKLKEMGKQLGVRLKEELNSKQQMKLQEDLQFAQALMGVLKKQHKDYPLIQDRDVFTTRHLHMIVCRFIEEDIHGLKMSAIKTGWNGPEFHKLNAELRSMTSRLVNSGLFMRRKTQQYVPVNPYDIEGKPSTTKATVVISDNFKRYGKMTDSALGAVMARQKDKANLLYQKALKNYYQKLKEAEDNAEVDTEVSFL